MDTWSTQQVFSVIALALLAVMFILILVGILRSNTRRQIYWIALAAWSICGIVSGITTYLYYWHHNLR